MAVARASGFERAQDAILAKSVGAWQAVRIVEDLCGYHTPSSRRRVDEKRREIVFYAASTSMHKGHDALFRRSSRTRLSRGGDGAAAAAGGGQPASMWSAMSVRGIF